MVTAQRGHFERPVTHHHFVEVTVEDEDTPDVVYTVERFTCTAPAGSLCRSWCVEVECEETCSATPILGPVEIVAQAPVDGHAYAPIDYCRIVEWLGAGDAWDRDEAHAEDEPLRPGVHPITEEWDDETYLWCYAEPAEASA